MTDYLPAIALFKFKSVVFLESNLEGKHYLAVNKMSAIIKISLSNMALNFTASKCNFTNTKSFLKAARYIYGWNYLENWLFGNDIS